MRNWIVCDPPAQASGGLPQWLRPRPLRASRGLPDSIIVREAAGVSRVVKHNNVSGTSRRRGFLALRIGRVRRSKNPKKARRAGRAMYAIVLIGPSLYSPRSAQWRYLATPGQPATAVLSTIEVGRRSYEQRRRSRANFLPRDGAGRASLGRSGCRTGAPTDQKAGAWAKGRRIGSR